MPPANRRRRRPPNPLPKGYDHWTPSEREAHADKTRRDTPIAEMVLSVRVVNVLEERGIIFAGQLLTQKYADLIEIPNLGEKTLREVRAALKRIGLTPPAWRKPPAPPRLPQARRSKNPLDFW